jgi:pimeloyl-ACP methyl ester carboxylesterase
LPGNFFATEAYDNIARQMVPRWTSTDEAIIAAYVALIDKLGPCIVICHSQGCGFGFRVAQARPDKFKALVAVVSPVAGDVREAGKLKSVPVLAVYGDFIDTHPRWSEMRSRARPYFDAVRAGGSRIDVLDLPAAGIRGNSHMLMMDRNNGEIAALIEAWLADWGLRA